VSKKKTVHLLYLVFFAEMPGTSRAPGPNTRGNFKKIAYFYLVTQNMILQIKIPLRLKNQGKPNALNIFIQLWLFFLPKLVSVLFV